MESIQAFRDLWPPYGVDPDQYVAWVARGLADFAPKGVLPEEATNSRRTILFKIAPDGTPIVRRIHFD